MEFFGDAHADGGRQHAVVFAWAPGFAAFLRETHEVVRAGQGGGPCRRLPGGGHRRGLNAAGPSRRTHAEGPPPAGRWAASRGARHVSCVRRTSGSPAVAARRPSLGGHAADAFLAPQGDAGTRSGTCSARCWGPPHRCCCSAGCTTGSWRRCRHLACGGAGSTAAGRTSTAGTSRPLRRPARARSRRGSPPAGPAGVRTSWSCEQQHQADEGQPGGPADRLRLDAPPRHQAVQRTPGR